VQSLKDVVRGFPRPARGRPGDPGLFGPGSLAWRINRESVLLLGGGRALLLQVANPMVAAGVADHSDFTANPYDRLWRTVDAALMVIFGDTEQAATAVERVTRIHGHVRGVRGGRPYSALDPDLLLWVHATLVESSIAAYDAFVHPLPFAVRERYYLEMQTMGTAFGVPDELHPSSYAAFRAYMDDTIAGLEIDDECRAIARQVLSPPMPAPLVPAGLLGGLGSIGLLPPRVRSELRLRWNRGTELAFHAMAAGLRATVPLLPSDVRFWPHARHALHRVASNGA
jgi:uncharacterized protein (DUF2236 family)